MIDPTLKLMMDLAHAKERNGILLATINAIGAHIGEDLSEMNAEHLADLIGNEMQWMRGAISGAYAQHFAKFEAARVESEMEGVIEDMRKQADYLTDEHYSR